MSYLYYAIRFLSLLSTLSIRVDLIGTYICHLCDLILCVLSDLFSHLFLYFLMLMQFQLISLPFFIIPGVGKTTCMKDPECCKHHVRSSSPKKQKVTKKKGKDAKSEAPLLWLAWLFVSWWTDCCLSHSRTSSEFGSWFQNASEINVLFAAIIVFCYWGWTRTAQIVLLGQTSPDLWDFWWSSLLTSFSCFQIPLDARVL